MAYADFLDLFQQAKESFIEGDYATAEPLLQQAILKNSKSPEVYQMLATLYYDRGQFNKAIKTFRKALEIDPSHTDASVGLSIILNDLGRYDEAKSVFIEAQERLEQNKKLSDPFIEKKLAQKHSELGDLYLQLDRHEDALEQYLKSKKLSNSPSSVILKIAECFLKMNKGYRAIQELQLFLRDYPQDNDVRLRLGVYLFEANRVFEAVEEWEKILLRDPQNADAKRHLKLAREAQLTDIATENSPANFLEQEF